MLLIERSLNSDEAVSPQTWESVTELKIQARDAWVGLVKQTGRVVGEVHREGYQPSAYEAQIIAADEVDDDLLVRVPGANEYYQETISDSFSTRTFVIDMATGQGASREIYASSENKASRPTDLYEVTPHHWQNYGHRLIKEIFEPGSHPELSKYAQTLKGILVDPNELPARLIAPEESKLVVARARLGELTIMHLVDLVAIYDQVAYPNGSMKPVDESELAHRLQELQRGREVDFVPGSQHFKGTKQLLRPSLSNNSLATSVYLNYEISVRAVNLYFRDDIEMMLAYARQARQYFEEQEIAL